MKSEPASIEPTLREINALIERIRLAVLPANQEYQRTKALMTLEAVRQILKAFCLSASPEEGLYFYEFAKHGK